MGMVKRMRWEATRRRTGQLLRSRAATVAFTLFALAIVAPAVPYLAPQLTGHDHAFIVLSGSMSPALDPGDVVFVRDVPVDALAVGDVISYQMPGTRVVVTHRIVEIRETPEGPRFRTAGDANEDPDPYLVSPWHVLGEVTFHLPKWGLLQKVVRTQVGYLAFVLAPGVGVIATEFVRLYRELVAIEEARARRKAAAAAPPDPYVDLLARLEADERVEDERLHLLLLWLDLESSREHGRPGGAAA